MRVLAVEDDPALADLLRRRLWREGHVVDVAPDGAPRLERAESGYYDAVILDLMLPDIDGVMVAQRLRAEGIARPS